MDILAPVFFIFALVGAGIYAWLKFGNGPSTEEEKRPIEKRQESDFLKTLENIGSKIPGFSEDDRELARERGAWHTSADFPQAWEYVLDTFKDTPNIYRDPKYAWARIDDNQSYKKMTLKAAWRDRYDNPGAPSLTVQFEVTLTLVFEPLGAGGTAINFEYHTRQHPPSLVPYVMPNMVKDTNKRLKIMCLRLSQDPNHGSVF